MTRAETDTAVARVEPEAAIVRMLVTGVLAFLVRRRVRATALVLLARLGIDIELVIHASPALVVGLYDGAVAPRPCVFVSADLAPRSKAMRRAALRGVCVDLARRCVAGTGSIAELVNDVCAEVERRAGLPAMPTPRERARWRELRTHALDPQRLIAGEVARLRAVGENGKADALETRAPSASRGEYVPWSGADGAAPSTGVRRAIRGRSVRKTARAA